MITQAYRQWILDETQFGARRFFLHKILHQTQNLAPKRVKNFRAFLVDIHSLIISTLLSPTQFILALLLLRKSVAIMTRVGLFQLNSLPAVKKRPTVSSSWAEVSRPPPCPYRLLARRVTYPATDSHTRGWGKQTKGRWGILQLDLYEEINHNKQYQLDFHVLAKKGYKTVEQNSYLVNWRRRAERIPAPPLRPLHLWKTKLWVTLISHPLKLRRK